MGRACLWSLVWCTACAGGDGDGGSSGGSATDGTGSATGSTVATGASGSSSTTLSTDSATLTGGGETETSGNATSAGSTSGGGSTGSVGTTGGPVGTPVVYVGSDDDNIHVYDVNVGSGELTETDVVAAGQSPSFLAIAPSGAFLFAVNEVGDWNGTGTGAIASFAIAPSDGSLTFIDRESSGGAGPAHVATDRTGKWVVASNYGGATVATLAVNEDGTLVAPNEIEDHGTGNHPHLAMPSPDNAYFFVPDLGRDQVMQYAFDDATGALTPNMPAAVDANSGDGPRHMDFHPTADLAFVVNELSDTVTSYSYASASGLLSALGTFGTLPGGVNGSQNSCADIHVSPDGRHLYASNRGHESIAVFSIDQQTGALTSIQHQDTGGEHPRNFEIDPGGELMLVANRYTDTVVAFSIDQDTGLLTPTGQVTNVTGPAYVGIHYLAP